MQCSNCKEGEPVRRCTHRARHYVSGCLKTQNTAGQTGMEQSIATLAGDCAENNCAQLLLANAAASAATATLNLAFSQQQLACFLEAIKPAQTRL